MSNMIYEGQVMSEEEYFAKQAAQSRKSPNCGSGVHKPSPPAQNKEEAILHKRLSDIPTAEEIIIEQIASFFEKKENWLKLRECWLENGYSFDLRRLLRKALEE